jgi:hypothetical protein
MLVFVFVSLFVLCFLVSASMVGLWHKTVSSWCYLGPDGFVYVNFFLLLSCNIQWISFLSFAK